MFSSKLGMSVSAMFVAVVGASSFGAIIYVDDSATGDNNGSSWEHAFNNLHDGLKAAQPGDEVRIGEGTYEPVGPNGDRTVSFSLPDGVIVRGGFAGAGAANPDQNDPDQFETILSGDLNANDGKPGSWFGYEENTHHVVRAENVSAEPPNPTRAAGESSASPPRSHSGAGISADENSTINAAESDILRNRTNKRCRRRRGHYRRQPHHPKFTLHRQQRRRVWRGDLDADRLQ